MAKREALRDLQARLAGRLQQAQNQGASASWLAVEVGDENFLLPLELAGEIFPPLAIHRVPYAAPWFVGVANLRGQLCGVVDLGHFLGRTPIAPKLLGEDARQDARYVAFNNGLGVNGALLVSKLIGLRNTGDYTKSEPPSPDSAAYLSTIYYDKKGKRWQELNLQALALAEQFLAIAT